jgi:hypothetical protein
MISIEFFGIDIIATEIYWQNKKLILPSPRIKHLITHFIHYKNFAYSWNLPANYNFKHLDIKGLWQKYQASEHCFIHFDEWLINVDYTLAPIHVSNSKCVLGLFIHNKKLIQELNSSKSTNAILDVSRDVSRYTLFSTIEPMKKYTLPDHYNKFNLFTGIINYRNENCFGVNKYNQLIGKTVTLTSMNNQEVELFHILSNTRNYFPKLDIVLKSNNSNIHNHNIFAQKKATIV